MYIPNATPISNAPTPTPRRHNRAWWWVIGIVTGLSLIVILGLLVLNLLLFTATTSNVPTKSPSISFFPTAQSSQSVPPTSASTSTSASVSHLAVIPSHFNVHRDCQVDNGYRCTIVIVSSQLAPGNLSWTASSNNLQTKFSPSHGAIDPNQQQQVIVYIYNACPYHGNIVFSTSEGTITVPLVC